MSSEIGVKLTGDNADFRSMLDRSVEDGVKFGGKLTTKLADKVLGLKDISHAVSTALGLNFEHIAENIARVITKMSKDEEEAFKRAADLSTAAADASIKNMRAQLTEEQRYQLALTERDRLQKQVDAGANASGKAQLALKEKEIALTEKVAEIQAYEAAQEKKRAEDRKRTYDEEMKQREAINEKQRKAMMATLTLEEKERAIREEIKGIEFLIAQSSTSAAEKQRFKNTLVEREAELTDLISKEREKHVATLQKKQELTFAALPLEEKILTYTTSMETLEKEIARAKKEGLNHDEYDLDLLANKNELAKLLSEKAEIANKEAEKQAEVLARQTEIQAILAKGVGALSEDDKVRLTTLAGQNSVLEKQIEIVNDLTQQFHGLTTSITRSGSDYETQSTAALMGTLNRLKAQINPLGLNGPGINSAFSSLNYGAHLSNAALNPDIRAIEAELARRREVGGYASRYGEDAARSRYGDADTDKALRDLHDTSTRSATALEQISNQLASSGIFPRNSPSR